MITYSDQIRHTCHSMGCPNSQTNAQCPPLAETQTGAGNKVAERHPATNCPKHLAHVVAIRQRLWQSLEKVYGPSTSCPIPVQLARDLVFLLAGAVVHNEEHVASHQLYVDVHCPAEKARHLPVEQMTVVQC